MDASWWKRYSETLDYARKAAGMDNQRPADVEARENPHARKLEDLSRDELLEIVEAALNLVSHHPGFSNDEWYGVADDHGDNVHEYLIPVLKRLGI